MLVAKLLETATTGRLERMRFKQVLILTFAQHLAFCLEVIWIDDTNPQLRRVQNLLQQGQYNWMCRTSAKTAELSVVNQIDGSLVNLFEGQTAA